MLYADDILSDPDSARVDSHLEECPVCRQVLAETQEVRARLRRMTRPELGSASSTRIKTSIRTELRSRKRRWLPVSIAVRERLMTRLVPVGVGVMASLIIGLGFLSLMLSSGEPTPYIASSTRDTLLLASNRDPFRLGAALSASDYAKTRLDISAESPSVNPQGALIALTKSLMRGGMKDDEVVVVADVFGNGLAQIAEVVEPSRDRRAVAELQKALESDPAYSPFVAANLDNRSNSVRVVLKFQSVNVPMNPRGRKP